jgi:hypothetical protein
MELISEEIENYLDRIAAASKIVDVDDKVLLFRQPTIDNKMESRRIYEFEYKKSIDEGLLSTMGMKDLIKERHLITDEERRELSSLKSKLDAQKVLLAKTTRVRAKQDRVKDIIHDIKKKIRDIEYRERSKFSMTAETKAEEAKILYLCWSNCYDFLTKKLYWDLYDEFLNETDYLFRQKVVSEFILFYGGIPTKYIRAIARSNLWRIRYVTSIKTSESLFGRSTSEYTSDMLNLAYWSHYYQNIFEMMEEDRPSEDIIEDNEALDAYMKDYYDERTRDTAARKSKNKRSGKLSAFDQEEVIVTKSNELYDDIEFDTPRESSAIKDKPMIRKKTRR